MQRWKVTGAQPPAPLSWTLRHPAPPLRCPRPSAAPLPPAAACTAPGAGHKQTSQPLCSDSGLPGAVANSASLMCVLASAAACYAPGASHDLRLRQNHASNAQSDEPGCRCCMWPAAAAASLSQPAPLCLTAATTNPSIVAMRLPCTSSAGITLTERTQLLVHVG